MSTSPTSDCSPSTSPVASNAPKFGTLVPNRIFVGGVAANTTEAELHELFSNYGSVKATKIISDRAGVSKGYGFVTFETEEEAKRIQKEADNIVLKERKLNIAPAIKKQPFARFYDPVQSVPNGTILYHNGVPYTYHNGVAFFTNSTENVYQYPQPQPAYPVVYPQTVYLPQQQYPYQSPTSANGLPTQYMYSAMQTPSSLGNSPAHLQSNNAVVVSTTSSGSTLNCTTSNSNTPNSHSSDGSNSNPEFFTMYNCVPPPNLSSTAPPSPMHQHPGPLAFSMVPGMTYAVTGPGYAAYVPTASDSGGTPPLTDYQENDSNNNHAEHYGSNMNNNNNNGKPGPGKKSSHYIKNYNGGYNGKAYQGSPKKYNGPPNSSNHHGSNGNGYSSNKKTPLRIMTSASNNSGNLLSSPVTPTNNNGGGSFYSGNNASNGDLVMSRTFKHLHGQQPHLVAKNVNGVTVMAYPGPMVVSSSSLPTTMMNVTAKDHQYIKGDYYGPVDMATLVPTSGVPMTPPPTPLTSMPISVTNGEKDLPIKMQNLSL